MTAPESMYERVKKGINVQLTFYVYRSQPNMLLGVYSVWTVLHYMCREGAIVTRLGQYYQYRCKTSRGKAGLFEEP